MKIPLTFPQNTFQYVIILLRIKLKIITTVILGFPIYNFEFHVKVIVNTQLCILKDKYVCISHVCEHAFNINILHFVSEYVCLYIH